jgi:methylmalonyl-CoA mutase
MSNKPDWSEFKPGTKSEWLIELNKSLKSPIASWLPDANINLSPIYFRDEIGHNKAALAKAPFTRGNKYSGNDWAVMERISADSAIKLNQSALAALNQGVDALCIDVTNNQPSDLAIILNQVIASIIRIDLIVATNPELWLQELDKIAGETNSARGSIIFDPFRQFESELDESQVQAGFHDWFELVKLSSGRSGKIRSAVVSTIPAHNAGAGPSLELAIALAKAHELLLFLLENGLSIDEASALFEIRTGIGTSFFTEIAKFRALRPLWAKIIDAYQPVHDCSSNLFIHAETAYWNMSANDVHTNLLRHTTEAMSAVYGGIDSLLILPFDMLQNGGTATAMRYSRNIQYLLKEESFASKVADPAGGAMYIEEYTQQMCEAAWDLFLEFENAGGYTKAAVNGCINAKILECQSGLNKDIMEHKKIWLGVNKYKSGKQSEAALIPEQLSKLYPTLELEKLLNEKEG